MPRMTLSLLPRGRGISFGIKWLKPTTSGAQAREAIIPGRIGIRKDWKPLGLLRFTGKADVELRTGAITYGFSCKVCCSACYCSSLAMQPADGALLLGCHWNLMPVRETLSL